MSDSEGRTAQEYMAAARANDELKLYLASRHGLPVWRAFMAYRAEGLTVPENILAKFDQWAFRLQSLQQQAADEMPRNEGQSILQALELAGDRKEHKGLKQLADLERRWRDARRIARLHERGMAWSQIASRLRMGVQAAKDVFYEFAPGPRRKRKRTVVGEGLVEAHRRMIAK